MSITGGTTGINIQSNTAGTITFGDVDLFSTAISPLTTGIDIGNTTANSAAITFATVDLTATGGTTPIGLNIMGQSGAVTVSGASAFSQPSGGASFLIDNASAPITLTPITITDNGSVTGAATAVQVQNMGVGGSATFGSMTLANSTTAGIDINTNATGTVTFTGPTNVNTAVATGIQVNNTSGAASILFPGAVNINTALTGILIDNTSGGNVNFGPTTISNATIGVHERNTSGGTVNVGSAVNITGGTTGISLQNNTGGTPGSVSGPEQTGGTVDVSA